MPVLTDVDYRRVLHLFPNPQLARRIFGTLENCRSIAICAKRTVVWLAISI